MAFKFVNGRIIDDSGWGSQTGTPSNNLFNLDFTPLANYGSADFSNRALWWNQPLDLNKKIDVSGNTPVITNTTPAPVTPEQQQKDPTKVNFDINQFGQLFTNLTNLGTTTGNKTLQNIGVVGSGLQQAGNYLGKWQSKDQIQKLAQKAKNDAVEQAAAEGKSPQELKEIGDKAAAEAMKNGNLGNVASVAGAVGTAADIGRNLLYSDQAATDSGTTNGINQAYDAVSSSLMAFSPVGTIVGGAMKAGAFLGDMAQSMGGGTDQMNTTDQIMDSSLFSWNIGLVNGFGGKKSNSFGVNKDVIAGVGGDYGGSTNDIYNAASLANKKYGLFSSGARHNANSKIGLARTMQNRMNDIWRNAKDRFDLSSSTSQYNYFNYGNQINGGIDYTAIRAREGGKLERIQRILNKEWEPTITLEETVEEFKQGGVIEVEWEPVITMPVEEFKEGGIIEFEPIIELEIGGRIDKGPESLTSQKNVIPDGALHKNKHHMENTEGLTQKGIPVVDNDGEQQAEIEVNEIIFSLEVTKKLENWYKQYYMDTLTQKEKDELAIKAGELLVNEILFNTEDNTGLIDSLKKGGILNGNIE